MPSWIEVARKNVDALLLDHAHCEKKAAATALSLLNRYPEREELVRRMIDVAREEMEHFALVYDYIRKRGCDLNRDPGNPYAQALHAEIRKKEPERLLDMLLVAALIEARSCERFTLLSREIEDSDLREFYRSLLASEAGHYRMYYDIACEYFPEQEVRARLDELADREAEIVAALPSAPTMHG